MVRREVARRRNGAAAPRRRRIGFFEPLEERNLLTLNGNQLFPDDSPWNRRIDQAPVAANSATLVANIGSSAPLHPDFGTVYEGANIGIPYNVVSSGQTPLEVVIDAYPDESDLIDVPIPSGAVIEGDPLPANENDGDRHLIVYDQDANIAYELYRAFRPAETGDGKWHADSEAVWDMNVNSFRTPGDTSADAAGLPILPGLVRVDEVLDQGAIEHALRFTVPLSRNQYVFPASHHAGSNNANYPRMGERFRLKANFDISGFSPTNRVILQALKDYGMIVADNGSSWFLSGAPSSRWNDDDLHALTNILGNNFEAVDLAPRAFGLVPAWGSSGGGAAVTINGLNFSGAAGKLKVFFGTTQATNVTIVSDSQLTVIAPPHAAGTVAVTVQTPYGTSASTGATQFTYGATTSSTVIGRHIFYNNSAFDGNNPGINPSDDNAIASNKSPLLSGAGQATLANITNYTRGINGIMIDLSAGVNHTGITAADFVFKVGANNSPNLWNTLTAAPTGVSVRPGAGTSGSDRVVITWADNTIVDTYLEVQVLANARTGLTTPDVFFWGNLLGETASSTPTGAFARTLAADRGPILSGGTQLNVGITGRLDINKSNSVTLAADGGPILTAGTALLTRISIATAGPFAPEEEDDAGDTGIASALATAYGKAPPPKSVASVAHLDPVLFAPHVTHSFGDRTAPAVLERARSIVLAENNVRESWLFLSDELVDELAVELRPQ
ncbi:MAG: IPT/TIG domain-containing protein [Pirellulales bacterium]